MAAAISTTLPRSTPMQAAAMAAELASPKLRQCLQSTPWLAFIPQHQQSLTTTWPTMAPRPTTTAAVAVVVATTYKGMTRETKNSMTTAPISKTLTLKRQPFFLILTPHVLRLSFSFHQSRPFHSPLLSWIPLFPHYGVKHSNLHTSRKQRHEQLCLKWRMHFRHFRKGAICLLSKCQFDSRSARNWASIAQYRIHTGVSYTMNFLWAYVSTSCLKKLNTPFWRTFLPLSQSFATASQDFPCSQIANHTAATK